MNIIMIIKEGGKEVGVVDEERTDKMRLMEALMGERCAGREILIRLRSWPRIDNHQSC